MQRRRQRGTTEARPPPGAIDHRHGQLRLEVDVVVRADVTEEAERLRIAPEQDMLAVVDELAGLAIGKCGRAAAEPRPRFEHEHARAAPREPHGGAEAGESGADDDDVGVRHVHSHCPSAISA